MSAAAALLAGDPAPARALLTHHGWRFAHHPALAERFLRHLVRHLPWPPPAAVGIAPVPPGDDPWAHREAAWAADPRPPEGPLTEEARLTCALEHLAFFGDRRLEDRATRRPERIDPVRDAETAALFAGFGRSRYPAEIQRAWEAAFLPDAAAAFLAEAEAGRHNPRLRRDLAEGFFVLCLGPPRETPIWRRLYARVLEQAPEGPITALAAHIPAAQRSAVARALVEAGSRAESAAIAFPLRGATLRAQALEAVAFETPQGLDHLLDFHLAVRLLATWQKPAGFAPTTGQGVLAQNAGRARSRLRALVAALPQLPPVPEAGLYHRTRIAVLRFFRDLARDWRHRGFAMGQDTRVDAPCALPGTVHDPREAEGPALLRTFLLRGLLLGHYERLRTWIPTGDGTGATAFYRYLDQDLPAGLDAPRGPGGRRDYQRVRLDLQRHLPELLAALAPTLEAVASLPMPVTSQRLNDVLRPIWHPAVPLPLARPNRSIEAARQLVHPPPRLSPPGRPPDRDIAERGNP